MLVKISEFLIAVCFSSFVSANKGELHLFVFFKEAVLKGVGALLCFGVCAFVCSQLVLRGELVLS